MNTRVTTRSVPAAFLLLLSGALAAHADDWPEWRGSLRDGVWREDGIVQRFPAGGLPVRWRTPVGAGYSGPAVVGGRVFLMDRALDEAATADVETRWNYRDKTAGRERVLCLDECSGKLLWKHSYPCAYSVAYGSGPRATPTVEGDKVYTLGSMGDLLCLDAATGRVVWQKNFLRDYGVEVPLYGFASPPLVEGDRLIAVVGGEGQAVMAFDRHNGQELWKAGSAWEPGYCAPIIRTLGGKRQFVVWHAGALVGLEPEAGKVLWSVPHPLVAGMAISTPAVEGDRLVVSSQYEGTMMLQFKTGQREPEIVWKASAGTVPERQWKKAGFNTTMSTVLLMGGHVYGVSLYGETCCLDGQNGQRVWTTLQPTSGGTVPRERWSTLFMVPHGDKVFLFTEKGDLLLARLTPAGYSEIDRTHILDPDMLSSGSAGRKVVWSHPAFANRCVYARNDHEIVCVSLAASTAVDAGPERQSLFNGRDLAGWEGAAGFWRVEDGAITGQTTPDHKLAHHTYLIWRGGKVADFELRQQFRLVKGNSGVQYRSRELPDFVVTGYQCNIETGRRGFTAVLEEMKGRGGHLAEVGQQVRFHRDGAREVTGTTGSPALIEAAIKPRDWNELIIRAEGPRLRHWVNGRLVVDVTDEQEGKAARSGILALQLHSGPPMKVQFKDIRLKRLLDAGTSLSASADKSLSAFLDDCGARYSESHQMIGQKFRSPGYHSTVKDGTWVHPVIQSLDYAVGLFDRNAGGDRRRAEEILSKVLTLQDTDSASRTYGIWPWLLEEPLAKMSPPDWNWADFCGARLAVILADHATILGDGLKQAVQTSLSHAARAIVKRNVGPSYTNIAIMGGGVCAAAGELLGDPQLLGYGRSRLQKVVAHTAHHGGFNEYNSPTYTMVALTEAERTLHLVRDPATREAAEQIRRAAWEVIAQSYHPGTSQWAGPHARSYSDYIFPRTAAYLSAQTGAAIAPHPSADAGRTLELPVKWRLPCPEPLKERFSRLPSDPHEIRRTFVRGQSPDSSTVGTTWLTADACLGSVNRGTFWTQCRPLIGYWKTDADPAVVLRVRFLHDGRDFASMGVSTAQSGGRCLVLVYPLRNQGDWHPGLDRPANGIFQASDFRLRVELTGSGVAVEQLGPGRWALRAGEYRAIVHTLPGRFAGQDIAWKSGSNSQQAFVDAICYQGPSRPFDFHELPEVVLATGVEILLIGQSQTDPAPRLIETKPRTIEAVWEVGKGLSVKSTLQTVNRATGS